MQKLLFSFFLAFFAFSHAKDSPPSAPSPDSRKNLVVYSSASCGCCSEWVGYMERGGYRVKLHKNDELFFRAKEDFNIRPEYQSCHTAVIEVGGKKYALEGHLPRSAIEDFVKNPPKNAIGIAAPGMPQGSPGMEQGRYENYPVLLLTKDGGSVNLGLYRGDSRVK